MKNEKDEILWLNKKLKELEEKLLDSCEKIKNMANMMEFGVEIVSVNCEDEFLWLEEQAKKKGIKFGKMAVVATSNMDEAVSERNLDLFCKKYGLERFKP